MRKGGRSRDLPPFESGLVILVEENIEPRVYVLAEVGKQQVLQIRRAGRQLRRILECCIEVVVSKWRIVDNRAAFVSAVGLPAIPTIYDRTDEKEPCAAIIFQIT